MHNNLSLFLLSRGLSFDFWNRTSIMSDCKQWISQLSLVAVYSIHDLRLMRYQYVGVIMKIVAILAD